MVLIDEEGTTIQASVLNNRNLLHKFRFSIVEGQIYKFANFEVTPNVNQYRACSHQFKITFTPRTSCADTIATIPTYAYSFFPILEIMKIDFRHPVDKLIDVVAFVKDVGTLDEFCKGNETKKRLRLKLADSENNEVECTLFDNCASDAYMAYLQNTESPVVVLLNLARVGFSEDGTPQVCSSFNATMALFNPSITEVKNLIQSAKDEKSPVMVALSQPKTSQPSQHSNGASLHNQTKVTISQIPEQAIGDSFVIHCQIYKLETKHGWIYDACSKCGSKVKIDDPSWICPLCKKKPDSIEPKMKIHYLVRDQTGSASVIFWDKLDVPLVKKTASELISSLNEKKEKDDDDDDIPKELDLPVGKNLLLKLKMNEFNKKYPTSSISVGQYTICEDLSNQFSEAITESSFEGCSEVKATAESVDAESVTPLVTPLDHSTISDLSQHVTPAPIKGKRRITNKRNVVKDDIPTTSLQSFAGPAEEIVTKVIKQEK
ncbi:hypothetical protein QN277_004053 [Acacia crassicarpa]|uniref:Replication factor A C-terminal domain-containing protein n=1 Tax=Acacia crassicarpa TaxID=499986 RepID=A0AAE1IZK7_9FABA|nr:hypothetical protein QN277_004053 [Acacia crassicarpa]